MNEPMFESAVPGFRLLNRGKVRDLYEVDAHTLLMVTTDRVSAFDVVLPTAIPHKGEVLHRLSLFWFQHFAHLVPNHLADIPLQQLIQNPAELALLHNRAMVVKKLKPLPIEAVVRGYLLGSGWKEYCASGTVCGILLPPDLKLAERLPQPIFTPSTKAEQGVHDENITLQQASDLLGANLFEQVFRLSLMLYQTAADFALTKGIIIADTKFEFGLDDQSKVHLIDEVLTADSSRFWPASDYREGTSPPSFDKQYLRDWLESLHWDKRPPAPMVPAEVVRNTSQKYCEVLYRLTGQQLM